MRRQHILCTTALISAVLIGAAGCSSSAGTGGTGGAAAGPGSTALPSMAPAPTMSTAADKTLPIEAYLFNQSQSAAIQSASDILVTRCMKAQGYTYDPAVQGSKLSGGSSSTPQTQTTRRYGVSMADATTIGYHATSAPLVKTGGASISSAEQGVLATCLATAQKQLGTSGLNQIQAPAMNINQSDFVASQQVGQVKAVFAKWSACMKAKGFSYATPPDADNDARWHTPTATRDEIATATADATCQQKENVVGVWFTVESALESRDIQAQIQTLSQVKTKESAALSKAAQLAGSN